MLTAAASMAPVPEAVRIRTSFCVWNTSLRPSVTSTITCLASAERWWITGRASSRSTSSGTLAGPGVMSRGFRISQFLNSSAMTRTTEFQHRPGDSVAEHWYQWSLMPRGRDGKVRLPEGFARRPVSRHAGHGTTASGRLSIRSCAYTVSASKIGVSTTSSAPASFTRRKKHE